MTTIESLLKEERRFEPSAAFIAAAHVSGGAAYDALYRRSLEDPESFWGERARADLLWSKPFEQVLDWQPPHARWFLGGQLNAAANCLDKHLSGPRRNKAALIWEGEPGEIRTFTYLQLHREVCKAANALAALGVEKGDRVAIYMPMIPEIVVAMLACARLGAAHTVVFGGFSAEALRDRILDAQAKLVITADGGFRRGAALPLKPAVDAACAQAPCVQSVLVVRRCGNPVSWVAGRDHWWQEVVDRALPVRPATPVDSEHLLFTLYTSGTTGKPKGIVHTTAGYLLYTQMTARHVFDLKDEDVYWCTADCGWITGHSYIVYGPLQCGATILLYEGTPNTPHPGRFWEMIERHRVTVFYTAPTAIRTFVKWGDEHPLRFDLSSLRLLGTVGEPINPEAWMWYHRIIGKERCPIVDTWWQTETGGILISPLPGVTATKPGSATKPFFGIEPEVVNEKGEACAPDQGGLLVIKRPWPSMLRTVYNDDQRYRDTYFGRFPTMYFTGDGARRDKDGYFWILGRVDDVMNVSGHRLSTMEIESALVSHEAVAEAAVVGRPDALTGQAITAFVTLHSKEPKLDSMREALKAHVAKEIGAFARPAEIRFAEALPKTRSGKIMRRLLRDIAAGQQTVGDTTTLEDLSVLARLREDED
jgi:acetyl-CoA synthetase